MLKILNEVIQNIREKEKNALIVLKGFNDEIFKEISKNIEPAFFPEFFLEQNHLQTLSENKKKLQKHLLVLEEGLFLAKYEEILIIERNLNLYDNKIYILENNLFKYYLYNFCNKEDIIDYIKYRDSEILDIHEKNNYDYLKNFFSDLVMDKENIYVSFKDLSINDDDIKIIYKNIFSYSEYNLETETFLEIDKPHSNMKEYSTNNFIVNENLKYQLLNNEFKDNLYLLIDKKYQNKSKLKEDLGILKYLCSLKQVNLILCAKISQFKSGFRNEIKILLKKYWCSDEFRTLKFYSNPEISSQKINLSQGDLIEEIIEEIENSKKNLTYNDIFITAPTGSGKSIFFQIPALYIADKYNYVTIIISPLKALMKDQIENLKSRGVKNACFLNSDLSFI